MPIRLSGLISGMDTDTLVQELVSAYSVKKDNYVKEQTKLEWKMDSWKSLNTKIYSFYTGKLSGMRFSTNYNKKAVKVADDTKATVTASSGAVNGDQSLVIKQLAKTGYLTGAELKTDANGNKVTSKTKLSELDAGFAGGAIKVSVEGKEKTINLTSDMNLTRVAAELKNAGLTANFDEKNGRFFVSAPKSGADNDFSIVGMGTEGVSALKSLGLYTKPVGAELEEYNKVAAWSDADIKKMAANDYLAKQITAANSTYTEKTKELTNESKELSEKHTYAAMNSEKKAEAYKEAQEKYKKASEAYTADIQSEHAILKNKEASSLTEEEKMKLEEYDVLKADVDLAKKVVDSYDEINSELGITVTTGTDAEGKTTYEMSEPTEDVEALLTTYKDKIKDNNEIVKANNAAIEKNNALLGKQYTEDEIVNVKFTAYGETEERNINYGVSSYGDADYFAEREEYYKSVRESAASEVANAGTQTTSTDGKGAVRIAGENATIVLNGAEFTSNTNNFSINGLTITAMGVSDVELDASGNPKTDADGNVVYKETTVTTSTDVDAVYDMVKEFITEYNTLIKEMDVLYNAAPSKGYEPLTDDEKEAMSDTEVEKWEKKIKDSLLRRDSTLQSVTNTMKNMMSQAYVIDGESYTLASFGIKTLGYFNAGENEKGVYHIDGDSEDNHVSGNEDKLKEALANDPDTVITFLSKMATGVYDTLTKKMSSSSLSSAYTLYNDKEMKSRYEDYEDTIRKWEDKVADIEDRYYKQFAAMESAMAELQSSTTALSSLMGG